MLGIDFEVGCTGTLTHNVRTSLASKFQGSLKGDVGGDSKVGLDKRPCLP